MQFATQKDVMESFNKCVEVLIAEIRVIERDNPDQLMAANKTHRLITKWFNHGGKIKKV